jgi:hypothetical protein
MPKKIISYKLNADGTVPDFVEDGGHLPKDPNDTPNMILLGVSKDSADLSSAEDVFETEADALAFVETYLSDSSITNAQGETVEFVVADAVAGLFAKLA